MYISAINNVIKSIRLCISCGFSVYVIIEGAGNSCIAKKKLLSLDDKPLFYYLYSNTDFENFISISPVIVKIDNKKEYIEWFLEFSELKMQGIIIITKCNFLDTVKHFQRFIEMRMENYNFAVFRYYNPIILNRYIHSIGEDDKLKLLGSMEAIVWPCVNFENDQNGHCKEVWSWFVMCKNDALQDINDDYSKMHPFIEISNETLVKMEEMRCVEMLEKMAILNI